MLGLVVRMIVILSGCQAVLIGIVLLAGRLLHSPMLAFTSDRDGTYNIYLVDVNTDTLVQVTHNGLMNSAPHSSPDGRFLVWLQGDLAATFYALDRHTYRVYSLGDVSVSSPALAWSPDGATLLVERGTASGWTAITALDAHSGGLLPLATEQRWHENSPSWSPDSQRFVYATQDDRSNTRLVMLSLADHRVTTLTDHDSSYPSWSPDGRYIAYLSQQSHPPTLRLMALDSTDDHVLTFDTPLDYAAPQWSPDSTQIAFGRDISEVMVYHLTTRTLETITPPGTYAYAPSWSPDGLLLVMVESTPGGTRLILTDMLTQARQPIAWLDSSAGDRMPAWLP